MYSPENRGIIYLYDDYFIQLVVDLQALAW